MSRDKTNMKLLFERRDRLRLEFEAAKARLEEVESLIRQMGGEPAVEPASTKPRRGGLKEIVVEMMEEAREAGLSAAECVAKAQEKRGITLHPASVSSTLSRFKADGLLRYDGERYRLRTFSSGPRSAA